MWQLFCCCCCSRYLCGPCDWSLFYRAVLTVLSSLFSTISLIRGSRGGQGVRTPPPLKYHKAIGFLSNTGPDPLENHKATMPAFYVGPTSARQRNAIKMAFRWRANDGPLIVVFESSLPLSNKQTKRCQSLTPSDKTVWIRECHCFTLFVFLLSCDS